MFITLLMLYCIFLCPALFKAVFLNVFLKEDAVSEAHSAVVQFTISSKESSREFEEAKVHFLFHGHTSAHISQPNMLLDNLGTM